MEIALVETLVSVDELKHLIASLSEEEKEIFLAEELEALPAPVRSRILQKQLPALIINHNQGSVVNNNSYQINANDTASTLELIVKLRQLER